MARILISDQYAQEGITVLEEAQGIELINRPGLSADELMGMIGEVDALAVRSATKVTPEVLAASGGRLAIYTKVTVGMEKILREDSVWRWIKS